MANPDNIAAGSMYQGYKNYASYPASTTISGTITAAAPNATYPVTINVARSDVFTQIYMITSVESGKYFNLTTGYSPSRMGSTPSLGVGGATYSVSFSFSFSGTQMTLMPYILNPYAETLTTVTENITFTTKMFVGPI